MKILGTVNPKDFLLEIYSAASPPDAAERARAMLRDSDNMVTLDGRFTFKRASYGVECTLLDLNWPRLQSPEQFEKAVVEAEAYVRTSPVAPALDGEVLIWNVTEQQGQSMVQVWPKNPYLSGLVVHRPK